MGFSNVDLPVAFWKALCGHWSQGSKGKRWPHPARVTVEVQRGGRCPSPPCPLLPPIWPSAHALFFLCRYPSGSGSSPSAVGPTYVGPGGRLAPETIGEWRSGECPWKRSRRLRRFSGRRKGSAIPIPLQAQRVPDVGAGHSSREGGWSSRPAGVVGRRS